MQELGASRNFLDHLSLYLPPEAADGWSCDCPRPSDLGRDDFAPDQRGPQRAGNRFDFGEFWHFQSLSDGDGRNRFLPSIH
jgi:hypothetical protein